MKKVFTLKMQGKTIVDLEVEGNDEIVEKFCEQVLLNQWGAFSKMRDQLSEFFIDGIKSQYRIIAKDEKGRFINPLKNK